MGHGGSRQAQRRAGVCVSMLRSHPLPSLLLGLCVTVTLATYVVVGLSWMAPGYARTSAETFWFATWPALFLAYPIVGALIASHRPRNALGWLFCAVGLLWALLFWAAAYGAFGLKAYPGAAPGAEAAHWFGSWAFFPALGLIIVYVPLLFPDGRALGPRWGLAGWSGGVGIALATISFAFAPGPLSDFIGGYPNPYGDVLPASVVDGFALIGFPLTLGSVVAAATSVVLRLRRSRGAEREQLKWIAFAATILAVAFVCHVALQFSGWYAAVPWYEVLWGAALCGIPVAAGIAILRRGLFDIDLVINRALVSAILTAVVAGFYILVVGGAGVLFRTEGGLVLPLLATGVVAVAFQPLRERVQRAVNRLLYGERDDPYAVLSRLGQRLEGTLAPEEMLPAIVSTMTEALRLPYAAIFLYGGAGLHPAAASGTPVAAAVHLPLVYGAEPVGELVVAPRGPGEAFGPADTRLLGDLARQIGIAAHAVRLTADLQQSRERLVSTREEERRRLRRDLHDGLGTQLAALAIQAGALRATIERDPVAAGEQAVELRAELRAAVADIRRLVHGMRPPALDELGLIGALRQRAARYGAGGAYLTADGAAPGAEALAVTVIAPDDLPPLPAAVEVAILRIVDEALTNVAKHAAARSCFVRLSFDDGLRLTIEDDGVGIAANRVAGVGLLSMRERAEELGGRFEIARREGGSGTLLIARFPLSPGGEG
jgi:signal transduction histidine kinase